MDKYIQTVILTIILCFIFFSILFVLIIVLKKYVYRKHEDFKKMLNNDETREKALLILNKDVYTLCVSKSGSAIPRLLQSVLLALCVDKGGRANTLPAPGCLI